MKDMRLHELQAMKKDVLQQLSNSLDTFIELFKKIKSDLMSGHKETEQAAVVITTLMMGSMEAIAKQIKAINIPENDEVH